MRIEKLQSMPEMSLWDVSVMIYNYMDLSIHIGQGVQIKEEVLLGYVSV
jgi:hypothetical protein